MIDRLYSVLANEDRRAVLDYFDGTPGETASLEDLADYLVDRRDGEDARSHERTLVRLHHVDLPKLAAAGIIDYDARTHTISYRGHPRVEKIEEL
ncbi:DUF7344 domain-containing protein [Haloprofundus salilacus]|uniref:DUF7344 domain-containing protein n=1 Tax=Haloprofundus salilacus TaxID=2876190 RepID=UPI001CCE6DCF|nr:hypothetical protein [Haloprofundus salilacus]